MARTSSAIWMALALVAALSSAAMATDQSQYQSLVKKYAASPSSLHPGKTACLCSGDIHVGWLQQGPTNAQGQIIVQCGLPTFDASGNNTGLSFCTDFITIAR